MKTDRGTIKIIAPLFRQVYPTPQAKLNALRKVLGVSGGRVRRVYPENAEEILRTHTGKNDVPYGGSNEALYLNLGDLDDKFARGLDVYQFEFEWKPTWEREKMGDDLPEPPEGWLHVNAVAEVKEVAPRKVRDYASEGRLTSMKCRGNNWYVKPDVVLDYWITKIPSPETLYRRAVIVKDLIESGRFENIQDVYDEVRKVEDELGPKRQGIYENLSVSKFFSRHDAPLSIEEWKENMDSYVEQLKEERDGLYE